jgi:hypothetical protein
MLTDAGAVACQSSAIFVPGGVNENVTTPDTAQWERISLAYGAPTVETRR